MIGRNPTRTAVCAITCCALAVFLAAPALAVVVISDGFGDADLDNNGTPFELFDTDVGLSDVSGDTYVPGRLIDGSGTEPTNSEVIGPTPPDAGDVGIPWFQMRGFTGSNNGDPKPTVRILDDSQGAMLETMAAGTGTLNKTAIDDGFAASFNSKGRGSSTAAFFGERIALGSEVGDQIKVSFDFRVWRDAPNANSFVQPDDAELRFGLYQDTDNQIGMTNPVAGRAEDLDMDGFLDETPAVWGEEEGFFEGALSDPGTPGSEIGAPGDLGWSASVFIGDFAIFPEGGGSRIREELNTDDFNAGAPPRILQGPDVHTIAQPVEANPGAGDFGFVNLDVDKVYNLSLTLERATEATPGDTVTATLEIVDLATQEVFTLSGTEMLADHTNAGVPVPGTGGVQSDAWDYFAIRNTGFDDFDFILDNFLLETFSAGGLAGDFNNDGVVNAADYSLWRDNLGAGDESAINGNGDGMNGVDQADYDLWAAAFGNSSGVGTAAVPEPTSLLLVAITLPALLRRRRGGI